MPAEGDPTRRGRGDLPLGKFYADLRALERRRRRTPVVALQIGDSHTANDAFSGSVRGALQTRFGQGGRGLLPPGIPFRTYNPGQLTVTASAEWQAISGADPAAAGPFGLTGLRQRAQSVGAEIIVEGEPGAFARTELEILRQPGGGSIRVEFDGRTAATVATAGAERRAAFVSVAAPRDGRRLRLTTIGAEPVELLGLSVTRAGAGIVYANLGTIGATIELTTRWDRDTLAMEMTHLKPSLLTLAFGTNEGFSQRTSMTTYPELFAAQVRMLAALAPLASVVVLGPPDGLLPRGRAQGTELELCERGELRPPHLAAVRDAQRRVATQEGWQFWDWAAAMGGDCSMARWVRASPSLALPDHVHLRSEGYRRTAGLFVQELLTGYQRWSQTEGAAGANT